MQRLACLSMPLIEADAIAAMLPALARHDALDFSAMLMLRC